MEAVREFAAPLQTAMATLDGVTRQLLSVMTTNPDLGLANATVYLDLFGRVTLGWLWLKQAVVAAKGLALGGLPEADRHFYQGKLHAMRYFFQWELPETGPMADLLNRMDSTCLDMEEAWF